MQTRSERARQTLLGQLMRDRNALLLVAGVSTLASCSEDGAGLPASLTGGQGGVSGGGGVVITGGAFGLGGLPVGGATGGETASGGDGAGGIPGSGVGGIPGSGVGGIPGSGVGGIPGSGLGGIPGSGVGGLPDMGGGASDIIDTWHGASRVVGGPDSFGVPQDFVNVVGRVSSPNGITSVSYQVNEGAWHALPLGPNNNRLSIRGDYNVEVPVDSLAPHPGTNHVRILATDELGEQVARDVSISYRPLAAPTSPSLVLDWSTLSDIAQVEERAAIVDGQWELSPEGLHVVQMGYDRLIALGDRTWSPGYEVVAEVSLHDFRTYGGVGIAIGWQGHTGSASPRTGWPMEALGWVRFRPEGPKVQVMTYERNEIAEVPTSMEAGKAYSVRVRSDRLGGGVALFSVKCWPRSAAEPAAFQLQLEVPERQGSVLLVAHHADVTWNRVEVSPTQ